MVPHCHWKNGGEQQCSREANGKGRLPSQLVAWEGVGGHRLACRSLQKGWRRPALDLWGSGLLREGGTAAAGTGGSRPARRGSLNSAEAASPLPVSCQHPHLPFLRGHAFLKAGPTLQLGSLDDVFKLLIIFQ